MWDEDYQSNSARDEIDEVAWEARRRRETEIVQAIFASLPAPTHGFLNLSRSDF
jgi:hypothetical protein